MKAILKQKHEGPKSLSSHSTIVERPKKWLSESTDKDDDNNSNNNNRSQNQHNDNKLGSVIDLPF